MTRALFRVRVAGVLAIRRDMNLATFDFYMGTLKGVGRIYQQTFIDSPHSVRHTGRTIGHAEGVCQVLSKLLHLTAFGH